MRKLLAGCSTDESLLGAINGDAWLYTVTGYDEDFSVAAVKEVPSVNLNEGNVFVMEVYHRYNDITLDKGSELYKDRLDFDKVAKIEITVSGMENDNNVKEIDSSDATVKEFISALYEGNFTEDTKAVSGLENHLFTFYDQNGLKTGIHVYENGYMILCPSLFENIVLKMDAAACKAFIDFALK